ncbi:unnamed protein product [Clonostachys byssicola]|uniref:Uncharacterized protein n=1 Tax=Clonostachys byssicola TaxID=160290 RepID=A0A9N9USU9_9HYPO|nr:unnamed protein product [Clonostachys byssicola]
MKHSRDLPPYTAGFGSMIFTHQLKNSPPPVPDNIDLSGKLAIITGASSGLGLESAKQLLSLGLSHLIIAVRSVQRGTAVLPSLKAVNSKAKIEVWELEMESYDSVQQFSQRCERELERIDIVILNAGISVLEFSTVATGHEITMQVNYYSTFLLLILLLPILKAKASGKSVPRIVVISSIMSQFAKFAHSDKRPLLASLDDTKIVPWDKLDRYNISKLVGQMFVAKLCEQVSAKDVLINMVEPGSVKGTGLFRNAGGIVAVAFKAMFALTARTVEVGALTYMDAAVVKGEESHGCLMVNGEIAPLAAKTYGKEGEELMEVVWKETVEEFAPFGCKEILDNLSA